MRAKELIVPFFSLWAKSSFLSQKERNRAYWFLDEDSRPDFNDEVEEYEQEAFEFIESLEDPDYLDKFGNKELIWALTVNRWKWTPEKIIEGISHLGAQQSDVLYQHKLPYKPNILYMVENYDQEDEIRDEIYP